MIDFWQVANNSLALLIVFLFFILLYTKLRHRTFGESWEEIKDWVGNK